MGLSVPITGSLMGPGSGGAAAETPTIPTVLGGLWDDGTTNKAAPLDDPYNVDISAWYVQDTTNKASVSNGVTSWLPNAANDPDLLSGAYARSGADVMVFAYTDAGAWAQMGFSVASAHSTNCQGIEIRTNDLRAKDNSAAFYTVSLATLTNNTEYLIAVVVLSTGFRLYIKGGAFSSWTYLWEGDYSATTPYYWRAYTGNNVPADKLLSWRYFRHQIINALANNSLALQNVSASSGTEYAAAADGVFDLSLTLADPLAGVNGFRYRVVGAQDYWTLYVDETGTLILREYSGGVASADHVSVASVGSAGAALKLRVVAAGNTHAVYTKTGNTWTKRGDTITDSAHSTGTGVIPFAAAGNTLGTLFIMPRTSNNYDAAFSELETDKPADLGTDVNDATSVRSATYLTTPTYDESGQAVHPSVLYFADGWNGYKYWMAMTPYPGANDDYENPSILVSNDGDTWSVPAGLTNPIEAAPTNPAFNADPDLFMVGNIMYCSWRYADNPASGNSIIYALQSTDGITWSNKQTVVSGMAYNSHVSQAIIYEYGTYHMWYVDTSITPRKIRYRSASALTGTWSDPVDVAINIPISTFWHLDVTKIGREYWMVINPAGTGGLYLAVSSDKITWYCGRSPLFAQLAGQWDENGIYRATLQDVDDTMTIWYSARDSSDVWHIAKTTLTGITAKT